MTRAQFTAAAAEERRVRLLDRSRAFYVDESYDPFIADDGTLGIQTHTGETIRVTDDLLSELTTEPAMLTVGELCDRLKQYPKDTPVVLPNHDADYGGITAESIDPVLLRPHKKPRPREARFREAMLGEHHASDSFEAVRIGHAGR